MAIILDRKRAVAVFLIIGGLTTAVYGANLFTQTLQQVTVQSAAQMIEGCDPTRPQNIPFEGMAGTVRFNCIGATSPPPINFPAAIQSSSAGTVIATFSLAGTGYLSLGVVTHGGDCTTATVLVSGAPMPLATGDYDYCASHAAQPVGFVFGQFSVSWSTP